MVTLTGMFICSSLARGAGIIIEVPDSFFNVDSRVYASLVSNNHSASLYQGRGVVSDVQMYV